MVTRRRLRAILNTLALYVMAGLLIGYFGINAFSGQHGLRAQQAMEAQAADLAEELATVKAERARWDRRVALLKPDRIDPDMLEERARITLEYGNPNDVTLLLKPN
jgi:cell division protein FtsB